MTPSVKRDISRLVVMRQLVSKPFECSPHITTARAYDLCFLLPEPVEGQTAILRYGLNPRQEMVAEVTLYQGRPLNLENAIYGETLRYESSRFDNDTYAILVAQRLKMNPDDLRAIVKNAAPASIKGKFRR